jgi:hypothetical protein
MAECSSPWCGISSKRPNGCPPSRPTTTHRVGRAVRQGRSRAARRRTGLSGKLADKTWAVRIATPNARARVTATTAARRSALAGTSHRRRSDAAALLPLKLHQPRSQTALPFEQLWSDAPPRRSRGIQAKYNRRISSEVVRITLADVTEAERLTVTRVARELRVGCGTLLLPASRVPGACASANHRAGCPLDHRQAPRRAYRVKKAATGRLGT